MTVSHSGKTVSDQDVEAETSKRNAFREWLGDLLGSDGFLVMPTVTDNAPLSSSTPEQFSIFREASIRLRWSGTFPDSTADAPARHG